MRILQIVQKPQRRGAEVFAFQLSQSLRQQGHGVCTVYLYPYTGDTPLPLFENDVACDGNEPHPFEKLPGIHPLLLQKVVRRIARFDPDVIQVNGARTVKYGAFAKKVMQHGKWVLIYRNIDNPAYWVRDPLRLFFYKKIVMPQIDGVIGVSQATLQKVKEMYALKAPAVFIPNGVDPAPLQNGYSKEIARQKLGVPAGVSVVLFMGNLTTQKRPDRFLRVMRQVYEKFPNVEAWILGDGPLREKVKTESQSLGIQHLVRFWGYQAEIAPYLAASDLLLVTSDSDGIPAVILEASMMGKPTIAAKVGGISDCVLEGETGFLIDPQNEEEMAVAVLRLLNDPQQGLQMGEKAHAWTKANFAIDVIGQRYFDFYRHVLAGTKGQFAGALSAVHELPQRNCHPERQAVVEY